MPRNINNVFSIKFNLVTHNVKWLTRGLPVVLCIICVTSLDSCISFPPLMTINTCASAHVQISLSLSLSIYIYIYIRARAYVCVCMYKICTFFQSSLKISFLGNSERKFPVFSSCFFIEFMIQLISSYIITFINN